MSNASFRLILVLQYFRCGCCRKYSDIEGLEEAGHFSEICELDRGNLETDEKIRQGQVKFEDYDKSPILPICQKHYDPMSKHHQGNLDPDPIHAEEESKLDEVVVSQT